MKPKVNWGRVGRTISDLTSAGGVYPGFGVVQEGQVLISGPLFM